MINLDNLNISLHAKERYAERIMGRDSKADITVYVQENSIKIHDDIKKLIEFGTMIYKGKDVSGYNNSIVQVFLRDCWVVIVDENKNNVITLFKIDLGLGKEFNDQYVALLLEKLDAAKKKFDVAESEIIKRNEMYAELIKENEASISEYKRIINSLEEQNKNYQDLIDSSEVSRENAEMEIKDIIRTLVGKKIN